MGDLLDRGSAFLDDQRHKHMSRTVVYQRGAEAKEVLATIGKTEFEQADDAGLIHRVESRDFLVRTADLDLGAGPILPRARPGARDGRDAGVRVRGQRAGRATAVPVQRPVSEGSSDSHQAHRHGDLMADGNGQNGTKARWAGVLVTIILAAGAMTIQWGVVTTKLQQVEKRLDEFIGEARSIRADYQAMERRVSYLEGKVAGLSAAADAGREGRP